MPGLIDAHVHLLLAEVNLHLLEGVPLTLLAAKGAASAKAMLMRGFTTVRDTGGADFGMKQEFDMGLFEGPRLFISGMPISQTGGHGDFRRPTQTAVECACCFGVAFAARIAEDEGVENHGVCQGNEGNARRDHGEGPAPAGRRHPLAHQERS